MKKKIIIPYEIYSSEFNGALCLANVFLKNGWTVYLGQKQQLFPYINYFNKSVWYLKSIVPGELSILKKIKKAGHFIASCDAEGLTPNPPGPLGIQARYSAETIELADVIFFWGESHLKEFNKVYPKNEEKFFCTGSQILDSWKKIFSVSTLKEKNKLLITTSLSLSNSYKQTDQVSLMKDNFKELFNEKHLKLLNVIYITQKRVKEKYVELLKEINENLNDSFEIILRPHPAENINFWIELCRKFKKKINIDNKSSLSEQIKVSNYVIHFASTLSHQIRIADSISIYYPSLKESVLKNCFNINVSKISHNINDPKILVKKLNNHEFEKHEKQKILSEVAEGFYSKEDLYSSNKIFNIITERFDKPKDNFDPFTLSAVFGYLDYNLRNYIAYILGNYFSFIPYFHERFGVQKNRMTKKNYKWRDITSKELNNLFINLKLNQNIKIKKHTSGFFKIDLNEKKINYN